jgi:hypothetical protein
VQGGLALFNLGLNYPGLFDGLALVVLLDAITEALDPDIIISPGKTVVKQAPKTTPSIFILRRTEKAQSSAESSGESLCTQSPLWSNQNAAINHRHLSHGGFRHPKALSLTARLGIPPLSAFSRGRRDGGRPGLLRVRKLPDIFGM